MTNRRDWTRERLVAALRAGDASALARAITLVENDDPAGWELVSDVYPHTGRASVVGFTGPPGVGKSTLLGALITLERERERTIAVLSILGLASRPFKNIGFH